MSAGPAPATLIPVPFVRPAVPTLAIPEAPTCAILAVSTFAAFFGKRRESVRVVRMRLIVCLQLLRSLQLCPKLHLQLFQLLCAQLFFFLRHCPETTFLPCWPVWLSEESIP